MLSIFSIEFKEPGAKTREPNLPKYNEDGALIITETFTQKNPQFLDMLNEQKTGVIEQLKTNIDSIQDLDTRLTNLGFEGGQSISVQVDGKSQEIGKASKLGNIVYGYIKITETETIKTSM